MAAFEYSYKLPGIAKVDAQIAGEVCMSLKESEQGLTPKTLVEASRPDDAPLHDEFEWNDSVAAELYREKQAGHLIRNLVITKSTDVEDREADELDADELLHDDLTVRAFVNTGSRDGNYVDIDSALNNEIWHQHLLDQAKQDCKVFMAKYKVLKELETVTNSMKAFIA